MPLPRLSRTLTWPVSLLVTTRSSVPLPVVSTAWTSETPRPTGSVTGGRKVGAIERRDRRDRSNVVAEEDREGAVAGIADDQVVPAVAVEVGRDDLRRELAGGERSDPDEAAVAVGVERDGVVLGVDAGEERALDRCSGTQAMSREGKPGLIVTGGSKVPGWPGMPWR